MSKIGNFIYWQVGTYFYAGFFGFFYVMVLLNITPGLPPYVSYGVFDIDEARNLTGPLEKNNILDEAQRLFENQLEGPGFIASNKPNEIFVSTESQQIVKIYGKDFSESKVVAQFKNNDCEISESCGRPLGLKFHQDGRLFIAHSGQGIYAFNVNTEILELVIDTRVPTDFNSGKIVADLEFDKSGNIYWTESSTTSNLDNGLISMLSEPTGRLMKYDPKTNSRKVLLKDLNWASGLQMSPDGDFLLISETEGRRILRYWLNGPEKGNSEAFVSRLPGLPDNIRPMKDGGYYVSIVSINPPSFFSDPFWKFSEYPSIRKPIARIISIIRMMANVVNYVYPNSYAQNIIKKSFSPETLYNVLDRNIAIVVEVNQNGEITDSLQGYSGKMKLISQVSRVGDDLIIASQFQPFLGRIPVSRVAQLKSQIKKNVTKPVKSKDEL